MKASIWKASGLVLVCLAVLLAAHVAAAEEKLPPPGALGAKEALSLLHAPGDRLTIVDVRTPEEYARGHVPGAVLIPLGELGARLREIPESNPVLLLCRTGRRAEQAYEILSRARPGNPRIWFLRGVPEYRQDGSFTFK